jgi:hypothetical protein
MKYNKRRLKDFIDKPRGVGAPGGFGGGAPPPASHAGKD